MYPTIQARELVISALVRFFQHTGFIGAVPLIQRGYGIELTGCWIYLESPGKGI